MNHEEYVEQEYFFRCFRERVADGRSAQEVLAGLTEELLSATRLPMAVEFVLAELKHAGELGAAFARLPHYFTPFQAYVVSQAEAEGARFPMELALEILELEAKYRAGSPTRAGLFVYQFEAVSRNRLGYLQALARIGQDDFYDDAWRGFIQWVRRELGAREFSELLFARSLHHVQVRRRSDPDYEPPVPVLFGEKEGKIAAANRGKDPIYLFATLQRQLNYPVVPRPTPGQRTSEWLHEIASRLQFVEARIANLEATLTNSLDLTKYYVQPPSQG